MLLRLVIKKFAKIWGADMKNMKIPVENNLDEIVGELERLGYKAFNITAISPIHDWIVAGDDGFTVGWFDASELCNKVVPLTNLAELKGMKC